MELNESTPSRPSTFSGSSATWCIGAGEVCERPNAEPQRLLRWDGRLRAGGLCKLVCIATGSGFQLCVLNYVNYYDFQVSTFNMQLSSFNMQLSSEFSTLRVRLVTSVLLLYFECLTPTVIQSCVINLKVEVHFEVWNFEVWSWKFWTTKYFELWTFELTLKHELWRLRCSLNWNVWKWTNSFNLIFYRCKARVTIKFVRSLLYGPSMVSGVCWLASLLTSESVWLAGLFD